MKVGIIQSNFLPWRGYFDFIRETDLFIVHDDLQYTKGDWRNRNKIKTPRGVEWITVPVHYHHTGQLIEETRIDYSTPWVPKMLNRIRESYRRSPCFETYFSELADLLNASAPSISDLNLRLIKWVCSRLEIDTPIQLSRDYNPKGTKTERLIGILQDAKATAYLSGPAAQVYLVPELFEHAGIQLEYKQYEYPEYDQLYPPFESKVSVIDLLFMKGKEAIAYMENKEKQA
ncbi:MAG TPA: WbqC family protein [Anaerolineales bacterium]|nr:WbqC family protein [Anaerolineales bacterium]